MSYLGDDVKAVLFLILFLFTTTVFAKLFKQLQGPAELQYLHQTEITYINEKTHKQDVYKFKNPITSVELSDIDDIGLLLESTRKDIRQALGLDKEDTDYIQILMHTDTQKINCYAQIDNGSFKILDHCKKNEGVYGSWVDLDFY